MQSLLRSLTLILIVCGALAACATGPGKGKPVAGPGQEPQGFDQPASTSPLASQPGCQPWLGWQLCLIKIVPDGAGGYTVERQEQYLDRYTSAIVVWQLPAELSFGTGAVSLGKGNGNFREPGFAKDAGGWDLVMPDSKFYRWLVIPRFGFRDFCQEYSIDVVKSGASIKIDPTIANGGSYLTALNGKATCNTSP
ncbi:MAG: hypothetical protein U1F50_14010 [Rubrivivax sp.]